MSIESAVWSVFEKTIYSNQSPLKFFFSELKRLHLESDLYKQVKNIFVPFFWKHEGKFINEVPTKEIREQLKNLFSKTNATPLSTPSLGTTITYTILLLLGHCASLITAQSSNEFVIASNTSVDSWYPFPLSAGNGMDYYVTYTQNVSNTLSIQFQPMSGAQRLGLPKQVTTNIPYLDTSASIFTMTPNVFGMVHEQLSANGTRLVNYRYIDSSGNTVSGPVQVATGGIDPVVARLPNLSNGSVICWGKDTVNGILCQRYQNLIPYGSQLSVTTSTQAQTNPSVMVDTINNRIVPSWMKYSTEWDVLATAFDAQTGNRTIPETLLAASGGGDEETPSIIDLHNGRYLGVYNRIPDHGGGFLQLLNSTTLAKFGSAFPISPITNDVKSMRWTQSADGKIFFVWTTLNGFVSGIRGKLIEILPNNTIVDLSGDFVVNHQYSYGPQFAPRVVELANDYYLAVWQSQINGTSNYEIRGRMIDKYDLLNSTRPALTTGTTGTTGTTISPTTNRPTTTQVPTTQAATTRTPTFFQPTSNPLQSSSSASNKPLIIALSVVGGGLLCLCIIGGVLIGIKISRNKSGETKVELKNLGSPYVYQEKPSDTGTQYQRFSGTFSPKESALTQTPHIYDNLPKEQQPSAPEMTNSTNQYVDSRSVVGHGKQPELSRKYSNIPEKLLKNGEPLTRQYSNLPKSYDPTLLSAPKKEVYANTTLVTGEDKTQYANSPFSKTG